MTSVGQTTIDITDAVEKLRQTFVDLAKAYLLGLALAVPGVGPFVAGLIKFSLGAILDWALTALSKWEVMQALFLNTTLRKSAQAQDFVDATSALNSLPPDVSDADYAKAEQAQMDAFRHLVSLVN